MQRSSHTSCHSVVDILHPHESITFSMQWPFMAQTSSNFYDYNNLNITTLPWWGTILLLLTPEHKLQNFQLFLSHTFTLLSTERGMVRRKSRVTGWLPQGLKSVSSDLGLNSWKTGKHRGLSFFFSEFLSSKNVKFGYLTNENTRIIRMEWCLS